MRAAPSIDLGALLPHDLDAERATLGALLQYSGDRQGFDRIHECGLTADDFYQSRHATIYGVMLGLSRDETPVDAITVAAELIARGELDRIGSAAYLHTLLESTPSRENGGYYARVVRALAKRRRSIEAADRLRQVIATGGDMDEALRQHRATLDELDAADGPATPVLRAKVLDRSALARLPRPQSLIKNTIDRRTVALLAGAPAVGKSFVALSWACCVATGTPWLGRAVDCARVLYVAAEGAFGLDARIGAWEAANGVTVDDGWLDVLPEPVQLLDAAAVDGLVDLVAAERYRLVVVDTFARSIVGADENSARDVGIAVDALELVRRATDDTAVLLVHHTGKDRSTVRGSSALEAAVDTVYGVDGDAALIKMTRSKRKEGPREDELTLRLVASADSVTIESHFDLGTDRELAESETRLLKIVRDSFGTTGATGTQLRDVAEMPRTTFYRALNLLVSRGALRNDGTQQRPFYVLGGTVA
ncbi:AAA family ATPase [Pseudofrankia inefficax]|uniref:AAA family ATPase n=1 Tax=Pseudofrankia inefficax (strain DSM 45817 / CECT 9037 / DDB 130130 / EuI1c) TaxID=298654 RepID=UPI000673F0CC|nr:AAA family ATPase [Pseudofrankia inefficax]